MVGPEWSEESAEAEVAAATPRRAEREGERTTVTLEGTRRQKSEQLELALESRGEASQGQRSGEVPTLANGTERSASDQRLMEAVVERANAIVALKRVRQNQGSPGIDGMTVEALPVYLATEWEAIRGQLLAGTCQPQPVRRHDIPKPGGGGIPTVLDRFIQQCLLQVQPRFDPTF